MYQLVHELKFTTATGPGWGMTYDGEHLIASDGSAIVVFWKLPTVSSKATEEVKRITVHKEKGVKQEHVNELQYVDGFIYANIW